MAGERGGGHNEHFDWSVVQFSLSVHFLNTELKKKKKKRTKTTTTTSSTTTTTLFLTRFIVNIIR